ncbi:MAG: ABC transporter ATP-binding protein [Syntrophales bacterium]
MTVPALEIIGLCKAFGGLPVISDVSLTLHQGERHLLIGPNGAGKTTLFNLIGGDLQADSGAIRLFGRDIVRLSTARRVHLALSRTYQILTLFPKDTLVDNVVLSLLGLSPLRWNGFLSLRRQRTLYESAYEVLARVGLGGLGDRPISQTSYGEKRRLEIAMALVQNPRLLLLDEPLAGLSAEERVHIQEVLDAIPRDVTILMIEHDMDSALSFAESITLLHYGKVIVQGTRAEVVAHPKTKEVYLSE